MLPVGRRGGAQRQAGQKTERGPSKGGAREWGDRGNSCSFKNSERKSGTILTRQNNRQDCEYWTGRLWNIGKKDCRIFNQESCRKLDRITAENWTEGLQNSRQNKTEYWTGRLPNIGHEDSRIMDRRTTHIGQGDRGILAGGLQNIGQEDGIWDSRIVECWTEELQNIGQVDYRIFDMRTA